MDQPEKLSYFRQPFWAWDHFALTACQKFNHGNHRNWFFSFRGGLNGFHARMAGAEDHYFLMHAWAPHPRTPKETEYHLASFFFHIDSAIECLVFALNALGRGVRDVGFRDIEDPAQLRRVSPLDMLGDPGRKQRPLAGYPRLYPRTSAFFDVSRPLLNLIFEQHNVSKHRHVIYEGGSMRNDPPPGFWEELGIAEEDRRRYLPVRDVILGNDLSIPVAKRRQQAVEEFVYFETVAADFFEMISEAGKQIYQDSFDNIPISKQLEQGR